MFDDDDDNDALYEVLLELLYWCFWPKTRWQWLAYFVLVAVLSYLKAK